MWQKSEEEHPSFEGGRRKDKEKEEGSKKSEGQKD